MLEQDPEALREVREANPGEEIVLSYSSDLYLPPVTENFNGEEEKELTTDPLPGFDFSTLRTE